MPDSSDRCARSEAPPIVGDRKKPDTTSRPEAVNASCSALRAGSVAARAWGWSYRTAPNDSRKMMFTSRLPRVENTSGPCAWRASSVGVIAGRAYCRRPGAWASHSKPICCANMGNTALDTHRPVPGTQARWTAANRAAPKVTSHAENVLRVHGATVCRIVDRHHRTTANSSHVAAIAAATTATDSQAGWSLADTHRNLGSCGKSQYRLIGRPNRLGAVTSA